MPFNGVPVVGGELVVEIMISLTQCNDCSNDMIAWAVAVVKRLIAEPVRKGIDTESGLLNEENPKNAGVDEAATPVTPAKTTDEHWKYEAHHKNDLEIVPVLPNYYGVFVEIGYLYALLSICL